MSDEIRQAFAHPSERAEATAQVPRDRISLRDHVVDVEIGAFQQERGVMQRVRFNVVVEVATAGTAIDDDVDRILSYDRLAEAIAIELAAERINLLETLAERVAARILSESLAARVFLRIEKIDRGPYDLGVEIVRARGEEAEPARLHQAGPRPRVLFLSNEVLDSPGLGAVLDRHAGGPLIVVVGAADVPAPQSPVAPVQRRIDLLAIEQNAWVLAGKDRRCVVVGTRTELDWAMKNGQICVWAPSKVVLDAVESPSASPRDATALAAWFAQLMAASELVTVGAKAPPATDLPVDLPVREEPA
ncbi:dihydroneopterin aldolase [Roseisalinus antarcticus]|uniref:Bifunctional dihydroneopterin aldolase/dihydroneopterin triphosphate 2'-epimerase n=1 Tax=Roseisalinus antarcticus TaxID=254357 RepID=A0A1Y5TL26_9RHOB|nr:dihydroneopterin aldolase [Roseisalinus antarcticus]SLN66578.1 bifunctional dihydroneopterin aldolase/dihydroneopterin triphosphate 2'-epimerase [Roseisalinus antarcticus]